MIRKLFFKELEFFVKGRFPNWTKPSLPYKIHLELKKQGIESRYEGDSRSTQQYLIFDDMDQAKIALPSISKYLSSTCTAAQTSGYTSIKLDNSAFSYIHIKGASVENVKKEILGDATDYEYTCEFIVSEFHAYMKISNTKTGEYICPASSVKPFGAAVGEMFIRDDRPYHQKYYRGDQIIDFGSKNPKRDKSSLSIKFLATKEQIKKIEEIVKEHKDIYTPGNKEYVFFENNCHVFVNKLFTALDPNIKPIEFARADKLDLNDKGPLYQLFDSYGPITAIIRHPFHAFDLIKSEGYETPKKIYNSLHKLYVKAFFSLYNPDSQDVYGNTMLMNSIMHENIDEALYLIEKGIDVNIKNNKGEIALHLAAALPKSNKKMELLQKITESTKDINTVDLYNEYIPLSFAVMSNDAEAIMFLVENGADARYINDVVDNLGNIASYFEAQESAKALYQVDPEILHFDNLTRQYPIFHEKLKHDDFEIPSNISPKDEDALYCRIHDVSDYFAPLYV